MAWTVRYVRSDAAGGGNGTTDTNSGANGAFTLAEAITHSTTNTGVNYRIRAGTYSSAADNNFSGVGLVTAPNWWGGFSSTWGDLDDDYDPANYPDIVVSGVSNQACNASGAYQWFSNLRFESACTTSNQGGVHVTGPNCRFWKVKSTNTAANANSLAFSTTGAGDSVDLTNFWAVSDSAASYSMYFAGNASTPGLFGIVCQNAGINFNVGGNTTTISCFIIDNASGIGILTNGSVGISNGIIYSAGGDGIETTSTTLALHVKNCIITESGGYGINASGGVNGGIVLYNNLYYSNTSGNLNNVFESQDIGSVTDGSSPFENAASDDFRLKSTSNGVSAGFPGQLIGLSTGGIGYMDIGALQRVAAGGGGAFPASLSGGIFQ